MARSGKEVTVSKGTVERMPRPAAAFGDMDRLFEDFFGRHWMRPVWEQPYAEMAFMPSVDVIDREDEVVVRVEVPGYRKEDIEVSASNSTLTIKGRMRTEEKEEKGNFHRCEISHQAFTRTLDLPAHVDDAKAKATMKDGMLELRLPKVEKAKRHTIAIN